MGAEICDGVGTGICDGAPSTCSSFININRAVDKKGISDKYFPSP